MELPENTILTSDGTGAVNWTRYYDSFAVSKEEYEFILKLRQHKLYKLVVENKNE